MNVRLTPPERLKNLRVDRKLTLHQLSEATGISASALENYESYDLKDMKTSSIVVLSKFYCVSTDYLLGLTECRAERWPA